MGSPDSFQEFVADAVVLEDDTQRVLGADPIARERYEDTGGLLSRAMDAEPEATGSVLVREGTPLTFHAIVHDLGREPTWREEWIVDALFGIFQEADDRKLRSLAMPMLGTTHGNLDPRRFVQLLRSAISHASFERLEIIRLVVPEDTNPSLLDPLREYELEVRLGP